MMNCASTQALSLMPSYLPTTAKSGFQALAFAAKGVVRSYGTFISTKDDVSSGLVRCIDLFMGEYSRPSAPAAQILPFSDSYKRKKASSIDAIMFKIRKISAYADDWDGYGSSAPSETAADDAERFAVFNLAIRSLAHPSISASSDGEINFAWQNPKGIIDLGFFGDGNYSYYAKSADGKEFFVDEASILEPLPPELLEIVSL